MEEKKITIPSFNCYGCRRWNCRDFCMGPGRHNKDEEGNGYDADLSNCIPTVSLFNGILTYLPYLKISNQFTHNLHKRKTIKNG